MLKQLKNATKKISAIGVSALMVGSAAFGAGLGDYPDNFVSDKKFNGKIVVGSGAGANDDTAANSIITNLKNTYSGNEEQVEITYTKSAAGGGSYDLRFDDDDNLFLNGRLYNIAGSEELDDKDLDLLADGKLEDDKSEGQDSDEYDYSQTISFPQTGKSGQVVFDRSSTTGIKNEVDIPVSYLNTDGELFTYKVTFDDTPNIIGETSVDDSGLVGSETITLLGKTFTFDSKNTQTGDLKLYSSSKKVQLNSKNNPSTTVELDSVSYKISLGSVGNEAKIVLQINGDKEYVEKGDSVNIAGTEVYINELFIFPAGGDINAADVELFIGSDELEIRKGSNQNIRINDKNVKGYKTNVDSTDSSDPWNTLNSIEFVFDPSQMSSEDRIKFLLEGERVVDPIFGIGIQFNGAQFDVKGEANEIELSGGSETSELRFTNIDGDEILFNLYEDEDGSNSITYYDDDDDKLVLTNDANTELKENNYFVLNSDENKDVEKRNSVVYTINSISFEEVDDKDNSVTINDREYGKGDEIGDSTDAKILSINSDNIKITSGVIDTYVITDGTLQLEFGTLSTFEVTALKTNSRDESITADTSLYSITVTGDANNAEVKFNNIPNYAQSEDKDYGYALTNSGVLTIQDIDADANGLRIYAVDKELQYDVSLVTGESSTTYTEKVSASREDIRTKELEDAGNSINSVKKVEREVVAFDVTSPVKDSSVTVGESNLIVVGGPVVNSVAKELVGSAYEKGKAYVKYFSDRNTVLVFGYTKEGTAKAAASLNGGLSSDKTLDE